jgi:hypothetical protein
MRTIHDRLSKAGATNCPGLGVSIRERVPSGEWLSIIFGNPDELFMTNYGSVTTNPDREAYHDGLFEGFQILVVNLYGGSQTIADTCGTSMKQKGFKYTIVASYGEGIQELCRQDRGRCPYTQLWLINYCGNDVLQAEARDRDIDKIAPFLEAVTDFWMGGGGLMLFFDNNPHVFDGNILLKHYLKFPDKGKTRTTRVRFWGSWLAMSQMTVATADVPTRQRFSPKVQLPAPGECSLRFSLRPGLVTFYEGYTISSAVDEQKQPLSTDDELWPFTPFAWTSEPATPPRAFILHYDPPLASDSHEGPGPIVLHGAFTSAYGGFTKDGTGRIIMSIACWLTRIEERQYRAMRTGGPVVKSSPGLTRRYDAMEKVPFAQFRAEKGCLLA